MIGNPVSDSQHNSTSNSSLESRVKVCGASPGSIWKTWISIGHIVMGPNSRSFRLGIGPWLCPEIPQAFPQADFQELDYLRPYIQQQAS